MNFKFPLQQRHNFFKWVLLKTIKPRFGFWLLSTIITSKCVHLVYITQSFKEMSARGTRLRILITQSVIFQAKRRPRFTSMQATTNHHEWKRSVAVISLKIASAETAQCKQSDLNSQMHLNVRLPILWALSETLPLIHDSITLKGKIRDRKCGQYRSIKPVEQKCHWLITFHAGRELKPFANDRQQISTTVCTFKLLLPPVTKINKAIFRGQIVISVSLINPYPSNATLQPAKY